MENGHASAPNGDLPDPLERHDATGVATANVAVLDAPADTPRAAAFSAAMPPQGGRLFNTPVAVTASNESAIASLLPPDIHDGLSDTGSRRSSLQPRVPSRQLLQTALDLAQKAVEMDKNNDVAGALAAYREAVAKLRVVMERVGVDPTSDGKRGGKNEDEGRTLRGIHDAYMARITLLSAYESSDGDDDAGSSAATTGLSNLIIDSSVTSSSSNPGDSPINDGGTPMRSPVPSTVSGRRKKSKHSKQSFGLDEEAELSGVEGMNDDEEENITEGPESARSQPRSLPTVDGSPRTSDDRPLPPLPASLVTADGRKSNASASSGDRYLINTTTAQGTINQRRNPNNGASMSSISELNSPRPSMQQETMENVTRQLALSVTNHSLNGHGELSGAPPLHHTFRSTLAPPPRLQGTAYLSLRPDPQPSEVIHRPFHVLRLLAASMDSSGTGAYITSSIHVDPGVWRSANVRSGGMSKSNGNAKLVGVEAKTRVCEALVGHLEAIKSLGAVLLDGQREERHGVEGVTRLTKAQVDQLSRVGDDFATLLDGLDDELDTTYKALQSKGVVANGVWRGKTKSTWGSRISARVDKMSRGSDSAERYVDILQQLFVAAQTIDEHLRCFTGPCTAAYHALPHKTYKQIEARITRAAQFVGSVIVPFVLDDLRQFMLGYLKGGLKHLED